MPALSRRHALIAAAALPFAPAILRATPARAEMPLQGAAMPTFNRFRLGAFEVTTLLAGTRTVDAPQDIFGMNVDADTFNAASDAAFIPTDKAQFFFTPTLVNTGSELVLFDTGLDPDSITATLASAGVTPDQVDTVVITHMHGDHIGGLMGPNGATFANARYVTGSVENNHWAGAANENYEAAVRPLTDKTTYLDDTGSVTGGITAMAAFGHSPGHMIYMLESEGRQLAITADTANHYVWSLGYPDWEVKFDADKAAAAATRRTVFGMLAADRVPFIGYHMPFPGMGYVEAQGDGFRYVPVSYQMML
jgi:glyoxylase-like metal-dependent hydrolase (beta-lactamase superfamily II)